MEYETLLLVSKFEYNLLSLTYKYRVTKSKRLFKEKLSNNTLTNLHGDTIFRVLVFVSDVWDHRVNVGEHPVLHNP